MWKCWEKGRIFFSFLFCKSFGSWSITFEGRMVLISYCRWESVSNLHLPALKRPQVRTGPPTNFSLLVLYFCTKVTLISDKQSSLHLVTGWQRGEEEQSLYRKHLVALREHFKQPHIHKTISNWKINKKFWESQKVIHCQDKYVFWQTITLISWGKMCVNSKMLLILSPLV